MQVLTSEVPGAVTLTDSAVRRIAAQLSTATEYEELLNLAHETHK